MKNRILLFAILGIVLAGCHVQKQATAPCDKQATSRTIELYDKLFSLMERGTMVAHQDDLAYGHGWYGEPGRSDMRAVCGDYPAIVGWELGHLELGAAYNLDSIYFDAMKRYIVQTWERGGITTVSWHGDNIVTGGTAWDCKGDDVVRSVLPGEANHERFLEWLDRLAVFFSGLKDSRGEAIPVIFRMYHEHTGGWFWWGSKQCTPDEYKSLWRMTLEYLRDKKQVHNLLYAYSPAGCADEQEYLERYPGDEYVDIVGFDVYGSGASPDRKAKYHADMERNLKIVTDYAARSGKVPVVAETGVESVPDSAYFTGTVYPLLETYKVSWILFWRNAWEPDKPNHYYIPYPGHPAAADFERFTQMPGILTNSKIK